MNRESVKKNIDIISAFAEGKVIQISNERGEWVDLTEREGLPMGTLEETPDIFRIKPETKYRPFANAKECWNEMLKHQPFGYVYFADDNLYHNIIMLAPEQGCHEAYIRIGNCTVRGLEECFRIFTFADGLPFGVKVEED